MIGVCGIEAEVRFCTSCPHSTCKARITSCVTKGGNKYHVSPVDERTYNGKVFRSKLEALYAQHLDNLKIRWEYEAKKIVFWTKETPTRPSRMLTKLIDFVVHTDRIELDECKGMLIRDERFKLKQLLTAVKDGRVESDPIYVVTKPDISSALPLEDYLKVK